jgi:hypothetical protein
MILTGSHWKTDISRQPLGNTNFSRPLMGWRTLHTERQSCLFGRHMPTKYSYLPSPGIRVSESCWRANLIRLCTISASSRKYLHLCKYHKEIKVRKLKYRLCRMLLKIHRAESPTRVARDKETIP